MNKTIIKNYAVWARNALIKAVIQRAYEYHITEDGLNDPAQTSIGDTTFTSTESEQRKQLIQRIRENGFQATMEEAAYTWFNRFTALRYMEVNGYLPSKVRIFTDENGAFKPEILKEALTVEMDGLDREKIMKLIETQETELLYQYFIITQCNALNHPLPEIFEKIGGWTELLFPSNLLKEGSIIQHLVEDIPESDWKDQIQIIGWLYQYYNTEPKAKVFADMKKNIKVGKENIPAATQLFTPDWIVRYMVENSLGRLWLEGHENSSVRADWNYYLDSESISDSVIVNPEEIRFLDPCMGSGHILIYAFDVLLQIYLFSGWSERDAVSAIIAKNLYGLDIDKRAHQLAYFSLMMKARKHDRRFLTRGIQPNLSCFQDVPHLKHADIYGSLMSISQEDVNQISGLDSGEKEHVMKLYHILSHKYDVVCTNPPYMKGSHMSAVLSDFVKANFPDDKSDLFSAFVIRCTQLAKPEGYLGFLTPYVWMFIQSYEKMRTHIYQNKTIETLIQFEYSAFEEATVPICAFVLRNKKIRRTGQYLRLTDFRGGMEIQRQKALEAIQNPDCDFLYHADSENFSKITGSPVAYWVSDNIMKKFETCPKLNDVGLTRLGMTTGENARFVRFWYEPDIRFCEFHADSQQDLDNTNAYYVPYNKGGNYRKWYGNNEYVLYWKDNGYAIRHFADANGRIRSTVPNTEFYFLPCASWSKISSGKIAFRLKQHSIFDVAGACYFARNYELSYMLGFLNSNVVEAIISALSPTLNYEGGQIASLPVVFEESCSQAVRKMVEENISLSKKDWDSFETSWDFVKHPLI